MITIELLINYSFHVSFLFIPSIILVVFLLYSQINFLPYWILKAIYQDFQNHTGNSIINDIRLFKPFIETEKYIFKISFEGALDISFKYHQLSEFRISYIGYLKKYKIYKKNMDNKLKVESEKIINKELQQFFHKTYYLRDIIQKKNKNLEIHIGGGDRVTNEYKDVFDKDFGIPLEGVLDFLNEIDKYLNSNNSLKKL
jgi:hypothetical protein